MAHADDAIHGATLNFVRGAMKRALLTREREFELARSWRETGDPALAQAHQRERDAASPLVREHIDWALAQRAAG